MLIAQLALEVKYEQIVEGHMMAITSEYDELAAHEVASVTITWGWSSTRLPGHILIFCRVGRPSKVDLIHAAFAHAL